MQTLKKPYPTKQIQVGEVKIGGGAPLSVQSMTFSKTANLQATQEQNDRLQIAGCDIWRVAGRDEEEAK